MHAGRPRRTGHERALTSEAVRDGDIARHPYVPWNMRGTLRPERRQNRHQQHRGPGGRVREREGRSGVLLFWLSHVCRAYARTLAPFPHDRAPPSNARRLSLSPSVHAPSWCTKAQTTPGRVPLAFCPTTPLPSAKPNRDTHSRGLFCAYACVSRYGGGFKQIDPGGSIR